MGTWSSSSFQIHKSPSFYLSGSINFDTGAYNLNYKKTGRFNLRKYTEIWRGLPTRGGTRIFRVVDFNKLTGSNRTEWTTTVSGNNAGLKKSGTYYICEICESDPSLASGLPACGSDWPSGSVTRYSTTVGALGSGYTMSLGSTSQKVWIVAHNIKTVAASGDVAVDLSCSGTTIIATPTYSLSGNTYGTNGSNGKIKLTLSTGATATVSSGTPYRFTGLQNGGTYTCTATTKDAGGSHSGSKSITTYEGSVRILESKDTSVKVKVWISKNYSGTVLAGFSRAAVNTSCSNNSEVELSGLNQGQTFTVYITAATIVDGNGNRDVWASSSDKTWEGTELSSMNCIMSGTTITLIPRFSNSNNIVSWKASLGTDMTSGSGGMPAKFELLANGITYTICFSGLNSKSTYDLDSEKAKENKYYDVRTYACELKEREVGTNSFIATAFQTPGAFGESNALLQEYPLYSYRGYATLRSGNVANGSNAGNTSIAGQTISVSGLSPNTSYRLYVYLAGCRDFQGYEDAVGYIDFTTKPIVTCGIFNARVTGKTITVNPVISRWNGSKELYYRVTTYDIDAKRVVSNGYEVKCDLSTLNPYVLTGLVNGRRYRLTFTARDNNSNPVNIEPVEVTTYGIQFTDQNNWYAYTRHYEDCQIFYTDGQKASGISQDPSRASFVRWWITDTKGNMVGSTKTIVNCRRSNPARFNTDETYDVELVHNTNYILWAEIDGVEYNGQNDTVIRTDIRTATAARDFMVDTAATGETVMVRPYWIPATSPNNITTVTVTLMNTDMKILDVQETTEPYTELWFVDLDRGTWYNITYTAEDNEGNTSSDYIAFRPGYNGTTRELTYKLTFAAVQTSTRTISFICNSNRALPAGRSIQYTVSQGDKVYLDWGSVKTASGAVNKYQYLIHNTETTLFVRIEEMRDRNGDFDTVETTSMFTKLLTARITGHKPHVHSIEIFSQGYANGVAYDYDNVFGKDVNDPSRYAINIAYSTCTIVPVRKGKGLTGEIKGTYYDYPSNTYPKRIVFYGLAGGRQYHILITLTDGINSATDEDDFWALAPAIRIYDEKLKKFRIALPYIYSEGVWYRAPMWIYTTAEGQTKWWETDPERNKEIGTFIPRVIEEKTDEEDEDSNDTTING